MLPKSISPIVNVEAQLELELVHHNVTVQHSSYHATEILPTKTDRYTLNLIDQNLSMYRNSLMCTFFFLHQYSYL